MKKSINIKDLEIKVNNIENNINKLINLKTEKNENITRTHYANFYNAFKQKTKNSIKNKIKNFIEPSVFHEGKEVKITSIIGDSNVADYTTSIVYQSNAMYEAYYNSNQDAEEVIRSAKLSIPILNQILSSNGVAHQICDTLSSEMTRKFIKLKPFNDDDIENEELKKKINTLNLEMKKLNIQDLVRKCFYNCFGYGASYLYIDLDDIDDSPIELIGDIKKYELTINAIRKGSLKSFKIIDPYWVIPVKFNTTNPVDKYFYNPEIYSVIGTQYHSSRFIKFTTNQPLDMMKPLYLFNGIPLIQYCLPDIANFCRVITATTRIIERCKLFILKTVRGNFPDEELATRMELISDQQNGDAVTIDKDTEELTQLTTSLAHFDDLISQYAQNICISAKINASELLGNQLKGFQSNGSYELQSYYGRVLNTANAIGNLPIKQILDILQQNTFGEIDDRIDFEFLPLEETTDKTIADILVQESVAELNKSKAESIRNSVITNTTTNSINLENQESAENLNKIIKK